MREIGRSALQNPLFLSAVAALFGIGFIFIAAEQWFVPLISSVCSNIGGALITAAVFGILFEYFGKISLINDSIQLAVGQSRASSLGVADFVADVTRINHKDFIRCSNSLAICSRYSSLFLESHRKEIYERLSIDKQRIVFIRMKDANGVPQGQGPNLSPDEFFRNLSSYNEEILNLVEIYETDRLLSYNYVRFDNGIWVKLYLNSATVDTPPAFFVLRGSPLFDTYNQDIDRLLGSAQRVSI